MFRLPPGDEGSQFDPAVVFIQFAAKGKEKVVWKDELLFGHAIHVF